MPHARFMQLFRRKMELRITERRRALVRSAAFAATVLPSIERQNRTLAQIPQRGVHSAWDAAVARRCASSGGGLRRALQQRAFEQRHRLHHAKGHTRRASAGDPGRAGSEVRRGEGTAEESPPAGLVTNETDYFRLADDSPNGRQILGCECNRDFLSIIAPDLVY